MTNKERNVLYAILGGHIVYGLIFIFRTSFVIDGVRYFCLFDDAMISMTFARNLAHGHGLVWNIGSPVEGFTNPLWTLYMAFWNLWGIPDSKISLLIQLTGLFHSTLNVILIRQLARLIVPDKPRVAVLAMLFTAFYLPLNNWCWQGMEVSELTTLVLLAVIVSHKMIERGSFSSWLTLILVTMVLLRQDMLLAGVVLLLFLSRKPSLGKMSYTALSILLATVLILTLARYLYFGEYLPNTYYLKMTGYPALLRILQGIYQFIHFAWHFNILSLSLALVPIFLLRSRKVTLIGLLIATQIAYSMYAGGDAWEWWGGSNRYISVVMPLMFLMIALGLTEIVEWASSRSYEFTKRLEWVGAILILLNANLFNMHHENPDSLDDFLLIHRPLSVEDNENNVRLALGLKPYAAEGKQIAIAYAGAIPFFAPGMYIDLYGKCDKVIARKEAHPRPGARYLLSFFPAHSKWDYAYSIGILKPDIVAQLGNGRDEAMKFLNESYQPRILKGFPVFERIR